MNSIVDFETHWNHRFVTWPIMLFTAVFIIWASLSEVDESVRGEGNVIPSGQTKIIQHLEGGIIEERYVKEGDVVIKGQPLFKLSQAFFLSESREKEVELSALYAEETRLTAEIEEKDSVSFDKKYKKSIPLIIKNEQSIFEVNRRSFNEELSILEETINKKIFK